MKDCKKIHPLLSPYMDGQLSPSERARVEKHIGLCADARKEWEQLGGLVKALRQMPDPAVPADLHDKIMAKLGRRPASLPQTHGFWGAPAWALSAAAVLLLVLLNQYPGWQDLLRVDRSRQVRNETAGSVPAPPPAAARASENKKSPQPFSAASKSERPASAPQPSVDKKKDALAGLEKEQDAGTSENAANEPQDQTLSVGSASGGASKTTSRALKPNVQALEASSEPAAVPASGQPAGSLDRSQKSLTYSREESTTTWNGNQGPSSVESQELVTDAQTFQKYWTLPHPGEAPPDVDFAKEAVVVLMAGEKPTAGYSINVSRLEEKADQWVIHYRVESPAADAATAQVLTHPWALQVIPKPSKPVVFQKDN